MVSACWPFFGAGKLVDPAPVARPQAQVVVPDVDCRPQCVADAEVLAETDLAGAAQALKGCLACPSATPSAYLLAADVHASLDDIEAGRRILSEATGRFPLNAGLWEALARLELSGARPDAALDAMATAYRLRPQDARLEAAYQALRSQHGGDRERAAARVDALILEAAGRYELGDTEGAQATLEAALQASDGDPMLSAKVNLRRGLLFAASNQLDEGFVALDAAARTAPEDDVELRADIGLAQADLALQRGDPATAEAAATRVTTLRPNDPIGHLTRSVALAHVGRAEPAVEALALALQLGLSARMTRPVLETVLASAPWNGVHERVTALIEDAWQSPKSE